MELFYAMVSGRIIYSQLQLWEDSGGNWQARQSIWIAEKHSKDLLQPTEESRDAFWEIGFAYILAVCFWSKYILQI